VKFGHSPVEFTKFSLRSFEEFTDFFFVHYYFACLVRDPDKKVGLVEVFQNDLNTKRSATHCPVCYMIIMLQDLFTEGLVVATVALSFVEHELDVVDLRWSKFAWAYPICNKQPSEKLARKRRGVASQ